jgi:AraC-like DNA-binding protein
MAYLTEWRLCLAADLLRDTIQTIETIARQVGYVSAFAFTAAFRRRFGLSPAPTAAPPALPAARAGCRGHLLGSPRCRAPTRSFRRSPSSPT